MAFDTCKCADDDRVMFVLSMLKAEAMHWWNVESRGKPSEVAKNTSWEHFTKRFKAQFYTTTAVKRLEEEFLKLEQVDLTVKAYTSLFIEKARFAECYVPTEERRIESYIWGLWSSIRELVDTRRPSTFEEAIDAAEHTEREKERQLGERVGDKRK